MSNLIKVEVSTKTLRIQDAYEFVSDSAHGAIDLFVGVVRNHHEGKDVIGLTYDVHDTLAEKVFYDICEEAQKRWRGIKIYLAHYKGELDINGVSIIIAVSSAHRAESFESCRYIIEEIKKRAPVWKREHYQHGKSEWLPGHSLKEAAYG